MEKHLPKCKCSLCGCVRYNTFSFKGGFICDHCLEFLRDGVYRARTR